MKTAALGFRAHSGWTALVALALENGAPVVLTRQRPHLVDTFTFAFRQPYHTAAKMDLEEARRFLVRARNEARRLAVTAIRKAQEQVEQQGFQLTHCALLLASGRPLPELKRILASHSLIHTADGELFREALLHANARCSLSMDTLKERELLTYAGQTLRKKREVLLRRLVELGKQAGSPWAQDEKFAALAAWLSLVGRPKPDRERH